MFKIWLLFLLLKVCLCQVRRSSDLNCNFSTPCKWQNATLSDSVAFAVVSDALADPRFPTNADQENFFARTLGPPGLAGEAALLSDIVDCQLGGAKLKFWYFHTGPLSRIDVCMRYPPGSPLQANLHCFEAGSNARAAQWQLASIELPPMTQPMELLIRARFESPNNLMAIDDIVYEAILCESSHRGAAEGAGGPIDDSNGDVSDTVPQKLVSVTVQAPTVSPDSVPAGLVSFPGAGGSIDEEEFSAEFSSDIRAKMRSFTDESLEFDPSKNAKIILNGSFDCNFDKGTLCAYQNLEPHERWLLANKPVSNPLTGIQRDHSGTGFFLYAGSLANRSAVYVLESLQTLIADPSSALALHFRYHLAGIHGRLRVCFLKNANELANLGIIDGRCPFQREGMAELVQLDVNQDPRAWRHGIVTVHRESDNKVLGVEVFFVADQLYKNYFVGLDAIKLVNQTDENHRLDENVVTF